MSSEEMALEAARELRHATKGRRFRIKLDGKRDALVGTVMNIRTLQGGFGDSNTLDHIEIELEVENGEYEYVYVDEQRFTAADEPGYYEAYYVPQNSDEEDIFVTQVTRIADEE